MIIFILAAIGIIGIIIGFWAVFYLKRFAKVENAPSYWKKLQTSIFLIGLILCILSWPGTYFMGYPLKSGNEKGRVVGIPFMVGYFDSEGRDYVGPLTMAGVIGNGIFWFLFPHILLAEDENDVVGMALSYPSSYHKITDEMRAFFPAERLERFEGFYSSRAVQEIKLEGNEFIPHQGGCVLLRCKATT